MVEVGRDLERSYGSNKKESAVFVTTAELAASISSLGLSKVPAQE